MGLRTVWDMSLGCSQANEYWNKGPNSILDPGKGLRMNLNKSSTIRQALCGWFVTIEGLGWALWALSYPQAREDWKNGTNSILEPRIGLGIA